jgi:hypothetical protein
MLFEPRRRSFSAIEPSQELMQVVVAVATHGGRREIVAVQLARKSASQRSAEFGPVLDASTLAKNLQRIVENPRLSARRSRAASRRLI